MEKIADEVSKEYPDVELIHMLADNAAMQIITNPSDFDVLVTENTFGDILSDEAAVIGGSMGDAAIGEFIIYPGSKLIIKLNPLFTNLFMGLLQILLAKV